MVYLLPFTISMEIEINGQICDSPEKLIYSDNFALILSSFNESMTANNPSWKEATRGEVENDFALALQVYEFWKTVNVRIQVGQIKRLEEVIGKTLSEIRTRTRNELARITRSVSFDFQNDETVLMELISAYVQQKSATASLKKIVTDVQLNIADIRVSLRRLGRILAAVGLEIEEVRTDCDAKNPSARNYRLKKIR